ncbi:MAG: SsrA-binding protein SmpB [Gammaproteobacteria bacterium]|nr:SsrA-binding protein SmpB [Gammaproteobacteria bacterium]
MAKQSKNPDNTIIVNRKARFEYEIIDQFEAGIALEGWEVKSIRASKIQLVDSHIILKNHEAFLIGALITPLLSASTHITPDDRRTRKLLLHHAEIAKLIGGVERKGYTLVPLSMYWKKNRVKVSIALVKGKKTHDKRATIKERDAQRETTKYRL